VAGKKGQRGFGYVRRLPSKRYQASYVGPDTQRRTAPSTFDTKEDAEGWLTDRRREIQGNAWQPPIVKKAKPLTFDEYATEWIATRNLKTRTREEYESLHERRLSPTFGAMPLAAISPDMVRRWYAAQGTKTPTARSHAYGLLRTIMGSAVEDRLIDHQPVHIRGAGSVKRKKMIRPATLDELEAIVQAMPQRYRLMTLLAAWTQLRFGELTELRRKDVDVKHGVLHVRRGVVHTKKTKTSEVGTPKSDAGVRDVTIPPHLMPLVREHLHGTISGGRDGLLFPASHGGHLAGSSVFKVFSRARAQAGRDDLRFHDLRHTGATLAAQSGATLAELMARLGHSTPTAAMRYQHAAADRDRQIAAALSALVEGSK
jgi:integrase